MPSVYPTRFSNPETLRKIRRDLLLAWLRPSAAYLAARGVVLPECGVRSAESAECGMQNAECGMPNRGGEGAWPAAIDYDKLAGIFLEPTPEMPAALVDSVFLIHGMAIAQGMEVLVEGAETHGLDLGLREGMTPADVAVRMWLLNPQLLEALNHSHELTRPRSFRYFSTDAEVVPTFEGPSGEQVAALEERLDAFYAAWGRGKGARVFVSGGPETGGMANGRSPMANGREWSFLVRHGGACRREGAMENGEPTSVFFRPQKYDLLKYATARGEMAVNCCCDRERRVLLRLFGSCLFGRKDFFPGTARYTLAPLPLGRECLACADIPGIESASLTEVHLFSREEPWNLLIRKADDVFELIERGDLRWPRSVEEITRATFRVKFRGAKRPRRLSIVPCNKALYGRDSDSGILERWLKARGFILDCSEDESLSNSSSPGCSAGGGMEAVVRWRLATA